MLHGGSAYVRILHLLLAFVRHGSLKTAQAFPDDPNPALPHWWHRTLAHARHAPLA